MNEDPQAQNLPQPVNGESAPEECPRTAPGSPNTGELGPTMGAPAATEAQPWHSPAGPPPSGSFGLPDAPGHPDATGQPGAAAHPPGYGAGNFSATPSFPVPTTPYPGSTPYPGLGGHSQYPGAGYQGAATHQAAAGPIGQWAPPSWPPPPPPGSGVGHWGGMPDPQSAQPQPVRRHKGLLALTLAMCIVLSGLVGALIGHSVWSGSNGTASIQNDNSGSALSPNNGSSNDNNGNSGTNGNSSNGSSGAGGSAEAIASKVDPGLVDVNTTLSYEQIDGAGTGMVITSNGIVLTNNHVVEGATSISVTDIGNGHTYGATVVGYDRSVDVAILKLTNASGLTTVNIASSSGVTQGEDVVAIGNAGGSGGTPSYAAGTVTGTNQSITASDEATGASEQLSGLLETNADVQAGDSGGPLVNSSGQVLGMDTAAAETGTFEFQQNQNQGYAIPINEAIATAHKIEDGNASSTVHIGKTAFLGVSVTSPSSSEYGGGSSSGAEIASVVSPGPAADAGLAEGDTITAFAGQSISSPEALTTVILAKKPGDTVSVQYTDTNGTSHTVTVQLVSGPPQ
jgi:S1-C subfamily serine protease